MDVHILGDVNFNLFIGQQSQAPLRNHQWAYYAWDMHGPLVSATFSEIVAYKNMPTVPNMR